MMRYARRTKVVLIMVVMAIVSCGARPEPTTERQYSEAKIVGHIRLSFHYVYRFHDQEANVTCWLYRKGIHCLPDNTIWGNAR